jgi:hypothetical protein
VPAGVTRMPSSMKLKIGKRRDQWVCLNRLLTWTARLPLYLAFQFSLPRRH